MNAARDAVYFLMISCPGSPGYSMHQSGRRSWMSRWWWWGMRCWKGPIFTLSRFENRFFASLLLPRLFAPLHKEFLEEKEVVIMDLDVPDDGPRAAVDHWDKFFKEYWVACCKSEYRPVRLVHHLSFDVQLSCKSPYAVPHADPLDLAGYPDLDGPNPLGGRCQLFPGREVSLPLILFLHTTSPGELLPEWSISLSPHGSPRMPG